MSMEKQRIFLVPLALRWRIICTRLAPTNPDYSMTRIIEPDEKQRIFLVLALRWRRRSSDDSGWSSDVDRWTWCWCFLIAYFVCHCKKIVYVNEYRGTYVNDRGTLGAFTCTWYIILNKINYWIGIRERLEVSAVCNSGFSSADEIWSYWKPSKPWWRMWWMMVKRSADQAPTWLDGAQHDKQ